MKCIDKCLLGITDKGLLFYLGVWKGLEVFADTYFAGMCNSDVDEDLPSSHLRTGFLIRHVGDPVAWKSKL